MRLRKFQLSNSVIIFKEKKFIMKKFLLNFFSMNSRNYFDFITIKTSNSIENTTLDYENCNEDCTKGSTQYLNELFSRHHDVSK